MKNIFLYLLILIPLAGAVAAMLGNSARRISLLAAGANLALAVLLLAGFNSPSDDPFRYRAAIAVLPALDLKLLVGVDGLGMMMVLLATIVTVCAVQLSPEVKDREGAFFACLLFISAGCIGAFVSLDLFFFYAFHELALIPTFLLIGIWGHGERLAAAWKITIYLALGSFILLLGLVALYLAIPAEHRTFDLTKLYALQAQLAQNSGASLVPVEKQGWIFLTLLSGFGILISLFPFHTWAPQGYAAAPTPASMLHAGVLKKFGLFGLLRVAYPLLPEGAQACSKVLLVLLVGNILYVGLVTIAQKKLDLLLGYSSVMHMGYIFLGLASLNIIGQSGAALLLFAHGLSVAALFAVMGILRDRLDTTRLEDFGGLARTMPLLSLFFGMALFASIGLPGFANFAAETMIFFGAFGADSLSVKSVFDFTPLQWTVLAGLWGVVISAVYMLRAYRRIFFGPLPDTLKSPPDLTAAQRWPFLVLIAGLLVVGFYPRLLVDVIKPGLQPTQPATPARVGVAQR